MTETSITGQQPLDVNAARTALQMIAQDMADDARTFDGKPFDGRTVVQATKELTEAEAHQVIEALNTADDEAHAAQAEADAADADDWPPVEGALL